MKQIMLLVTTVTVESILGVPVHVSDSLMEHNLKQKHEGQGCQLRVSQLCTKCLKLEKLSKIFITDQELLILLKILSWSWL